MRTNFHLMALLLLAALTAEISLEWDRNPESDIAGYAIHQGRASRSYTNAIGTPDTFLTVTNLELRTRYYFAATAINDAGLESDFSSEVQASVRPITFWLEKSSTLDGPWRAVLTNVSEVVEGQTQVFYRVRLAL